MEVEFSADWKGLAITAVFEAGAIKKDVVYTGEPIIIPHEVLATEGLSVMIGFHGALPDGTIVKRTVPEWINNVSASLDPSGESSSEPTPDWTAQVQAIATEAKEVANSVRNDADEGKFNGGQGPQGPAGATGPKGDAGAAGEAGGYYTPAVTQPDENTLRVAFTPSKEDMPAVAETDITLPAGGGGGGSGTSGEDGGYYAPSVDDEGNLTWTASKTDMPAVDSANIKGPKGDTGATGATGPAGADGKSAYAYAVEGGYTGTEEEFAAKLAQEKYANPNALTFTGAVTGSYDGSEAVTVEIPSGGGGDNPLRLIKTVTLAETVKSITVDTDNDGDAFSLSEIYIITNVTNSEGQTEATSVGLDINGKALSLVGTTAQMNFVCGKTGESGRNWIWLMSLNPLRVLHGTWVASNISSGKTVQCWQTNEFNATNPNPYSVGEKITSIKIYGVTSKHYLAAGSQFRIYGR